MKLQEQQVIHMPPRRTKIFCKTPNCYVEPLCLLESTEGKGKQSGYNVTTLPCMVRCKGEENNPFIPSNGVAGSR